MKTSHIDYYTVSNTSVFMERMKAVTQGEILITLIANNLTFHLYPSIRCSIDLNRKDSGTVIEL